jgi:outer membrane protein assembly factor BamA
MAELTGLIDSLLFRSHMPIRILAMLVAIVMAPGEAAAQTPDATRQQIIEAEQAEKAKTQTPQGPSRGEAFWAKTEDILTNTFQKWHPFLQNAVQGGGFAPGVGYRFHTGAYDTLDVRGSYSIRGYQRAELEYVAPRLFERRAKLALLGGWRKATQVAFFGVGNDTQESARTNFGFEVPHASATLTMTPTRRYLTMIAGAEWAQWKQVPGTGEFPPVDTVYTPDTLPGIDADVSYLHTQASVGFDWRTSPGYTRRGGLLLVTGHDYHDGDGQFGFNQVDYEAIQHVPILREAWVLSFRGHLRTTTGKDGQAIPFFMLPWIGGGTTVRGSESFRYRDENSLLFQAEWRIMVNRYVDLAFFYDAGKVAPRVSDFDLQNRVESFGGGFRFHGPFTTPLRIELAKGREGFALVFATTPVF